MKLLPQALFSHKIQNKRNRYVSHDDLCPLKDVFFYMFFSILNNEIPETIWEEHD